MTTKKNKNKFSKLFFRTKNFLLKYKYILLILFLFISVGVAWELYSLDSYRKGIYAAIVAQSKGDFEEANSKLQEVKTVTNRSIVLYLARRENITNMIVMNDEWRKIYKETDSLTQYSKNTKEEKEIPADNLKQASKEKTATQYLKINNKNNESTNTFTEENFEKIDIPELPNFPDWDEYSQQFKIDAKTYNCSEKEIEEITASRYKILDDIWTTELAKFNDRKACYDEIKIQRALCVDQACQIGIEQGYWTCIEASCGQYTPQACDSIYDSSTHQYNITLSLLNSELIQLNKRLDVCWEERLF